MIDRLNRLEKLGYIDVESWLRWREIRNRLAHEYPDHPETRFAAIEASITAASNLAEVYPRMAHKVGPLKPHEAALGKQLYQEGQGRS